MICFLYFLVHMIVNNYTIPVEQEKTRKRRSPDWSSDAVARSRWQAFQR